MKFYHGTSKENWAQIQQEGWLWGKRGQGISRCTYLAADINEAKRYGTIVLEVEYDINTHPKENNYTNGCWQFRVYEPIPISNITQSL